MERLGDLRSSGREPVANSQLLCGRLVSRRRAWSPPTRPFASSREKPNGIPTTPHCRSHGSSPRVSQDRVRRTCRPLRPERHAALSLRIYRFEAVLLAQRVDKRYLGRVRPKLREQLPVNRIDGFRVMVDELMDSRNVGRCASVGLRDGRSWHEAENGGEQDASGHGMLPQSIRTILRAGRRS